MTRTRPYPHGVLQGHLLAAIEAQGGEWSTRRAWLFYRTTGLASFTRTARRDLELLARAGLLDLHDEPERRHYTLRETTP